MHKSFLNNIKLIILCKNLKVVHIRELKLTRWDGMDTDFL